MAKSVETLALSQVMQNMTGLSLFPIATIYWYHGTIPTSTTVSVHSLISSNEFRQRQFFQGERKKTNFNSDTLHYITCDKTGTAATSSVNMMLSQ